MKKQYLIILVCISFLLPCSLLAKPIEISITVDDIPAAGDAKPKPSRLENLKKFVASLEKHNVPEVYGFLNGILVDNMAERHKALDIWMKKDRLLGNHTYSHNGLNRLKSAAYIKDIEDNEHLLLDYAKSIKELKVFRYPFLEEGANNAERYNVRSYLSRRKYRIAQVSIDSSDWAWLPAFLECQKNSNTEGIKKLQESFVRYVIQKVDYTQSISEKIWGNQRYIPHILLLHLSASTSHFLDALLSSLKEENVKFISSKKAIFDPFYNEDTGYLGVTGKDYITQALETRKLSFPDISPPQIPGNLKSFCK